MRFWQNVRDLWNRFRRTVRLKPERVQKKSLPPFDIPMTLQRIQDRGAHLSKNWQLITSVTAIQFHYRFTTFQEAVSFVNRDVGKLADEIGYSPQVEIDGGDVVLTLGVEMPQILTEGDFDFAEGLDGIEKAKHSAKPEPPAAEA